MAKQEIREPWSQIGNIRDLQCTAPSINKLDLYQKGKGKLVSGIIILRNINTTELRRRISLQVIEDQ